MSLWFKRDLIQKAGSLFSIFSTSTQIALSSNCKLHLASVMVQHWITVLVCYYLWREKQRDTEIVRWVRLKSCVIPWDKQQGLLLARLGCRGKRRPKAVCREGFGGWSAGGFSRTARSRSLHPGIRLHHPPWGRPEHRSRRAPEGMGRGGCVGFAFSLPAFFFARPGMEAA